jgi:hypothetical protein
MLSSGCVDGGLQVVIVEYSIVYYRIVLVVILNTIHIDADTIFTDTKYCEYRCKII